MMRLKSKVKNFLIKATILGCVMTILIANSAIEDGMFIASIPMLLAMGLLYLIAKANGWLLSSKKDEEHDAHEEYEEKRKSA